MDCSSLLTLLVSCMASLKTIILCKRGGTLKTCKQSAGLRSTALKIGIQLNGNQTCLFVWHVLSLKILEGEKT